MTIEDKKEYLKRYRLQLTKIERLNDMMATYPDTHNNCFGQLNKAIFIRDMIEAEIAAVNDGTLSEVLSQKYINGRSLEEIAERMCYSTRHIQRLHRKALEVFMPFGIS